MDVPSRRSRQVRSGAFLFRARSFNWDAERQVARIRHGRIDGWMEAMTMDFPVRDPSEFAKLKIGQRIRATVFQRESDMDYWVGAIEVESGQP